MRRLRKTHIVAITLLNAKREIQLPCPIVLTMLLGQNANTICKTQENFVTLYDMTVCSLHMICKEEEVKSDRKRMFIYMSTNQIGYEHK